jgi:demethylmenaquinone methyltransferase/2-methoxy-6-polyprenyl-1,4-benzoquinol methylase
MKGFDHFGLIAPWYDRHAHTEAPRDLLRLVEMPSTGLFLDAGGGTGKLAQYFTGEGKQVIVVDISLRMVRLAGAKKGVQAVCAAAEKLPFPSDYFDRIVMVDAFHHVADQSSAARELCRILRPGGRLVIEEPDIRTGGIKLVALAEKILLMRSHFLKPATIAGLFQAPIAAWHIETKDSTAWIVIKK